MKSLNNKGNASILLCLLAAGLMGVTAFAVDIGIVYVEKAKLLHGMDAAVLAGALELPTSETKAKDIASLYLNKNNIGADQVALQVGVDKKTITAEGSTAVKHFFAPLIGIEESTVKGSTKAIIGPAKSLSEGIRPFAVQMFDFTYGDLIVLKENAGDGIAGNYWSVALGGRGSSIYRDNALYGYQGKITVGDYIDTETGNMAGTANAIKRYIQSESSSFNEFKRDSIRLWTLPLVEAFVVSGRSEIKVVGFAKFYVEDILDKAGKIEIRGRFVRFVGPAEIDMNLKDTGVYGVKLSK